MFLLFQNDTEIYIIIYLLKISFKIVLIFDSDFF